jgi:hypothetical protein
MPCILQLNDENVDSIVPVPAPYPAAWFPLSAAEFEPPEGWDPTRMNWFDCDGRYISVLAEDGVPYTHPYPDMNAPVTLGAESYYMNERAELPVAVAALDGTVSDVPAGPLGVKHSPTTLKFVDELFAWHDRDLASNTWNGASNERAFVRARLIEWDKYLLAVGGLVQGVTQGELQMLQNLEVSPEFYVLADADGRKQMQIVTASFVKQGNSRTSASSNQSRRAEIRFVAARGPLEVVAEDVHNASAEEEEEEFNEVVETIEVSDEDMALLIQMADVDVDLTPLVDVAVDLTPLPAFQAGVVGETALAKRVVALHDESKETREKFYDRVAAATGRDRSTVKQLVNGQISCPPIEVLRDIAGMSSSLSVKNLVDAANSDGCQRYDDVDV